MTELALAHSTVALTRCRIDVEAGTISGLALVWDRPNENGVLWERESFSEWLRGADGVPLLWQHEDWTPIGRAEMADSDDGLEFTASLNLETQQGSEARALLQQQAITGVSVGAMPLEHSRDEDGVLNVSQADLWELSLVTFPAERDARVRDVHMVRASARARLARARHRARRR